MITLLIIMWILSGYTVALLAQDESKRMGLRIPWMWWIGVVLLGPVIPLTILLSGERRKIWEEMGR